MQDEKMTAQLASHPLGASPLYFWTDQGMASKMTSRRLMMDFQCLAPVTWCMAKPNIVNSIDESLPCGCQRIQL